METPKADANVRSQSTIDRIRAVNEHAQGNRANAQGGAVRYESYRIQHKILGYAFTDRHSQLESLKQQLDKLKDQLTESSTRLSKIPKAVRPTNGGSCLWQRYWTATAVGIISVLITNLIWMIL